MLAVKSLLAPESRLVLAASARRAVFKAYNWELDKARLVALVERSAATKVRT
jgi:hypothetical protein